MANQPNRKLNALEKIIRTALIERDMTMQGLADEMNVRRERVWQILTLKYGYRPTEDVIINLALATNVPFKDIQDAVDEVLGPKK